MLGQNIRNLRLQFYLPVLITAILLVSCSRQLYHEKSTGADFGKINARQLNVFLEKGAEKKLNTNNASANDIIKNAQTYLGVPHCMGGTSRKCIDCSGLLLVVFASQGIQLPHSSEEQARFGKIIYNRGQLQRGDLVYFTQTYSTSRFITHSGIYLGSNDFIHTSTQKGVIISSLTEEYWSAKFVFGTRVFGE